MTSTRLDPAECRLWCRSHLEHPRVVAGFVAAATPSPGPSPPPGGKPPPATATITVTLTGADPREVTIRVGGRVTFVNQDTVPHDMNSDPHPAHTDCPSMDAVAFLAAGQTKESAPFPVARTCGFHDHNQPTNTTLQGRIIIQ